MLEPSPHCCYAGLTDTGCFKHLPEVGLQLCWDQTLGHCLERCRSIWGGGTPQQVRCKPGSSKALSFPMQSLLMNLERLWVRETEAPWPGLLARMPMGCKTRRRE